MTGLFGMAHAAKTHAKNEIAKARAARAHAAAQGSQDFNNSLEKRLDKLTIICMALWSLLSEKCKLTEEELMARVAEIDAMDGNADGRLNTGTATCPQCGRPMAARVLKCQFCGAERPRMTAFDDVL